MYVARAFAQRTKSDEPSNRKASHLMVNESGCLSLLAGLKESLLTTLR